MLRQSDSLGWTRSFSLSLLLFGSVMQARCHRASRFSDDLPYRPALYGANGCPLSRSFYGWTPPRVFMLSVGRPLASLLEALVIDVCPAIPLRTRCRECRANGMAQWSSSPAKYNLNSSRYRSDYLQRQVPVSLGSAYNSFPRTIGQYEGCPCSTRSCRNSSL